MKRSEMRSHGVRLLLSNHKDIRKLKKGYRPTDHGHKVWPTTWLLIDYLKHTENLHGEKVLDLACGWGLPGIFCARVLKSHVTWIDGDGMVYPYLKVQAENNSVIPNFMAMDIEKVGKNILKDIDVVIASDICFCDSLIDPLRRFINRAKKAAVSRIYISDPGRWPFDDLSELFLNKSGATLIEWEITNPVNAQGKILELKF